MKFSHTLVPFIAPGNIEESRLEKTWSITKGTSVAFFFFSLENLYYNVMCKYFFFTKNLRYYFNTVEK